MFEQLVGIRGQLTELVAAVDPDAFSGATARQCWAELDKVEKLAAAGKTLLARRLAQTHRPQLQGTKTAAEDLASKSGTSTGQAKDSLDTSQRLPDQPSVDGALRRGELSPAQAALISAAAAADPSAEARLVDLASQVSLAELREECARVRAAADPDPEATNRRLHRGRALRRYTDPEGFWTLHAEGTPQAGAAFNTILDPIIDRIFGQARRQGRHEPVEAYGFDALMAMAGQAADGDSGQGETESADGGGERPAGATPAGDASGGDGLDGSGQPAHEEADTGAAATPPSGAGTGRGAGPGSGAANGFGSALPVGRLLGDDTTAGADPGIFAAGRPQTAPTCPPASRSVNPRYLALLRVDVQALRRGRADGEEMCEIQGVGPVPVSVARDLLGQAIVKLVITRGTDVLNVTHLGRGPTAAQRAALLWMNPTCAVQGCTRTRVEWDHQIPWAETHHTRLDELDALCEFHHDLKTRCGYALVPGKGKRAFVPPDDPRHPARQPARAGPAPPPSDHGPPAAAPKRSRASTPRRRAFRQSPLPITLPDG